MNKSFMENLFVSEKIEYYETSLQKINTILINEPSSNPNKTQSSTEVLFPIFNRRALILL